LGLQPSEMLEVVADERRRRRQINASLPLIIEVQRMYNDNTFFKSISNLIFGEKLSIC